MPETYREWDVVNYLDSVRDACGYLAACLEEEPGDGSLLRLALSDIARAKEIGKFNLDIGKTDEELLQSLAENGILSFATVMAIARRYGYATTNHSLKHPEVRKRGGWLAVPFMMPSCGIHGWRGRPQEPWRVGMRRSLCLAPGSGNASSPVSGLSRGSRSCLRHGVPPRLTSLPLDAPRDRFLAVGATPVAAMNVLVRPSISEFSGLLGTRPRCS